MKVNGRPMDATDHRHGTNAGFSAHQVAGERPCDPCYRAKQAYDRRRLSATPYQAANRRAAKAQSRALQILRHNHEDEYQVLYRLAKEQIAAEEETTRE